MKSKSTNFSRNSGSLKSGMNPLYIQRLLGHATLEMTRRYIQMVEDDVVEAHKQHGPIDNILHRK